MEERDRYFRNFIFIALGILIIAIIFPFLVYWCMGDWEKSGTFGDTFGAINAIFSGITVAGLVITILMQRVELHNQRQELRDTRNEFSVNRITNVIYSQLERYEKAVEQLIITHGGKNYKGYEAIFFLDSSKQMAVKQVDEDTTAAMVLQEKKDNNCRAMTLYSANHISIAQFALAAYNSVNVVKESLLSSTLSIAEINNLKNLLFRNIGFIQLAVLEDIDQKYLEYLELSLVEGDDYIEKCLIETGKLSKGHIFLKSILKFRNTVITETVLEEIRANWTQEFGLHA